MIKIPANDSQVAEMDFIRHKDRPGDSPFTVDLSKVDYHETPMEET